MITERRVYRLLFGLAASGVVHGTEAESEALIRRVANGVVEQTTRRLIDRSTGETFTDSSALPLKPEISIESKFNAWFYQTWLLTDGMRRTARFLGEPAWQRYGEANLEFVYRHMDYFERQHAAGLKAAPVGDGSLSPIGFYHRLTDLWHTGLAPLVVEAYTESGDPRYRPYLARIEAYLKQAARLPDGTCHRARNRLMADDPYMIVPYLVRLHRLRNDPRLLDDAVQQALGSRRVLFDLDAQLYRHAYDVARAVPLGQFWGRANGWMVLTHVELLAALPHDHKLRPEVLASFQQHAAGLRRRQAEGGGWHQLIDHPESWIETSSTGMFVYGLARGVNEGWLDRSYRDAALRGWSALKQKITATGDVIDVCASTDVGDVNYYLNRPRLQGDLHGFGPFLLAGPEIIRLLRTP